MAEVRAKTTLSASMKRDSSPPEAIRAKGPGVAPVMVATSNWTRSRPWALHSASGSGVKTVRNRAFSSFKGGNSLATAASSFFAAAARALVTASATLR